MGLIRAVKAKIIEKAVIRNKKENPFDIVYADSYKLPADAQSRQSNSHYFIFTDFATNATVFLRTAVRGGNDTDEYWLMYRDADGRVLLQAEDHTPKGGAYPVRVECVEPGRKMRFSYDGEVVEGENTSDGYLPKKGAPRLHLTLDGEFTGTGEVFEFSYHMSPKTMARAISREKFGKGFRETMKAIHQIHYEQAGRVTARISVDGLTTEFKDLPAARDHSFGRRDWNYFDRYIWTIGILENGDFIHTSLMRYPALSYLQAGFYETAGKGMKSMICCTEMDHLPVTGSTPGTMEFAANYEDGERKRVLVTEDMKVPYLFDNDFKVVEGVYEYKVNGIRGRGIVEFAYNKDRSRWTRKK
ncbi:hypothetical protein [uncultured Alistipes sp.]|jgi:putative uncharacterized protein (fragment)|uniref:hypothetical protein n=1 Tax=uncultured Alistipes sp. TaxID=538949 RepID=UPI0025E9CA18|nr:hypothetical protein [uncultured Alistipes sp.]